MERRMDKRTPARIEGYDAGAFSRRDIPADGTRDEDMLERMTQLRVRSEERSFDPWSLNHPLAPEDAFTAEIRETSDVPPEARGERCPWLRGLIAMKCCGWNGVPTPAEMMAALQAAEPDLEQEAMLSTVIGEGTPLDWVMMHHHGVFSWRQLRRAAELTGPWTAQTVRDINRFAEQQQ